MWADGCSSFSPQISDISVLSVPLKRRKLNVHSEFVFVYESVIHSGLKVETAELPSIC